MVERYIYSGGFGRRRVETYKKCVNGEPFILKTWQAHIIENQKFKQKKMNAPGSADSNDVFVRLYGANLIPLKIISECRSNI